MDVKTLLFSILFYKDFATSVYIQLNGPSYVRRGEDVVMNCSSDNIPYDKIAEFFVNDETVTYLFKKENGCYSAEHNAKCDLDKCSCSKDGKSFIAHLGNIPNKMSIEVKCKMKFKTNRTFFLDAKKKVMILDIVGPSISTQKDFPLIAGTNNQLQCSVETRLSNVHLSWNCLNISSTETEHYNNSFVILSRIEIKSEFHGVPCSCVARYNNFTIKSSLILDVSNPPLISADTYKVCNTSSFVVMSCVLYGDLTSFGFDPWSHIVDGLEIRQIHGINVGNVSSIEIKSCSYQDSGQYICNAWNNEYFSNKTTILTVNDVPVIVQTNTYGVPSRVLSVQYYAHKDDITVKWYKYETKLQNSTSYTTSNARHKVFLDIHGIMVQHSGYMANLSLNDTGSGRYTIVLSHKFGDARYTFNITSGDNIFHIRSVYLVLTGVIVFVLMSGMMSGILIKFRRTQILLFLSENERGRSRYYAAPEDESNMHTYNTTDPHYIEVGILDSDVPSEYEEIDNNLVHSENQYNTNADYLDVIS